MSEPDGTRRLWRRRAKNEPGGRQFRHVVKVTAAEEARLVVLSRQQRVTIPRLLVSSALSRDTARITVEQQRELLTELFAVHRLLANMANNVNQVAKATNSTGEVPPQTPYVYEAAFNAIRRVNETIDSLSLG